MKNNWFTRTLISYSCLISACIIAFSAVTLAWFTGTNAKTEDNQTINGGIDLRGYFYAGSGEDAANAYEIVTCDHFNNLVRLQNLGIFSSKKAYFQIGHDFGGNIGLKCISGYDNSGNPIYSSVLDMGTYSRNRNILPIGSEGTPFTGEFDGNNIPILNLRDRGYPEDIGVFGYVSY